MIYDLDTVLTYLTFTIFAQFTVQIYPSEEFAEIYNTDTQSIYIAVIVVIFVVVIFLLCMYDLMVIARQRKILHIAKQTNTLISSLFPKAVQKRILEDASKNEKLKLLSADEYDQVLGDDSKAKSVMEEHIKGQYQTKAIADYFPSATIFVSANLNSNTFYVPPFILSNDNCISFSCAFPNTLPVCRYCR